jgi:hypothetical protein
MIVAGPAVAAGLAACSSSSSNTGSPLDGGGVEAANDVVSETPASQPDVAQESGLDAPMEAGVGQEASQDVQAGVGDAAACPTDGGLPDDLACTGLYSDWATKTIASDVQPFTPALVFWSDGAVKTRWIYLPPGAQIDTTDMDNWVFPVGTKIWKQFVLNGALIETRLIWKTASGWVFLDYRWSSDGSTAKRLDSGETNVNGTTYEIPGTAVCPQCHGGRPDKVLGFDVIGLGLNGSQAGLPAAQGVTLASLVQAGRLTHPPPADPIVIPNDSTAKAAAALAYLHVNCGETCHNANGGLASYTGLHMKLMTGQLYPEGGSAAVSGLDTYTTTVGVPAHLMPNATTYSRIAPGAAMSSLLVLMASSRDFDGGFLQMPPIVSHSPDTAGLKAVIDWINALSPEAGADH